MGLLDDVVGAVRRYVGGTGLMDFGGLDRLGRIVRDHDDVAALEAPYVAHPVLGTHRVMRAPWLFQGAPACAIRRHGPLLGQDNDYVLGEVLGMGEAERAALAEILR